METRSKRRMREKLEASREMDEACASMLRSFDQSDPFDPNMLRSLSEEERYDVMCRFNRQRVKAKAQHERLGALEEIRNRAIIETLEPLPRLPNEIWMMILDYLNAASRYNFLQAYPLLKDRLFDSHSFKNYVLLPKYVSMNYQREGIDVVKELLLLKDWRNVSKEIRGEIDALFHNLIRKELQMNCVSRVPWLGHVSFVERSRKKLANLIAQIKESNYEYFCIERGIRLCVAPTNCEGGCSDCSGKCLIEFIENATKLLERIGSQLIRFDLETAGFWQMKNKGVERCNLYNFLLRWIAGMENLEWLNVTWTDSTNDNSEGTVHAREKLRNEIQCQPFPKIGSLVKFGATYHEIHQVPCEVIKSVLENNPQIRHFHLRVDKISEGFVERFPTRLMKNLNLESLVLENKKTTDLNFDSLESIINFSWPLKMLDVCISKPGRFLNELFALLNGFDGLEIVRLRRLELLVEDCSQLPMLNLPKLKEFHMSTYLRYDWETEIAPLLHLRFLTECRALEKVKWVMTNAVKEEIDYKVTQGEIAYKVNFGAGIKDLYQSNVWDFFPCLNEIRVKVLFTNSVHQTIDKVYRRKLR